MNRNPALVPYEPMPPSTILAGARPYPTGTARDDEEIDLPGFMDILSNSKRLILSVTLASLLAGAAYAFLSRPVYRADALIQLEQPQAPEAQAHVLAQLSSVFNVQATSTAEMEILRSRLVVGEATDHLQLYVHAEPNYLPLIGRWLAEHNDGLSRPLLPAHFGFVYGRESIKVGRLDVPPELENRNLSVVVTSKGYELHDHNGHRIARGTAGQTVEFNYGSSTGTILLESLRGEPGARFTLLRRSRLAIIEKLQEDMMIDERGKPSGVLALSLEGNDPVQTAAIVNAIGEAYVKQNTERRAAEAEQSLSFLDGFLPQLRQQLDAADDRYTAFRDQHGTFDLGTEGRLSLETSVTMQTRLFELQQRRRELSAQYGPQHPVMQSLDEQISAVQAQVARLSERIKALPALEQQLVNLVRDVTVNSELYAGLLNSAQQLRLVKEGKVGSVRLVDAAMVPEAPVKPRKAVALAIAALAGLLLGVALAVLRNIMKPGLRTPLDVEHRLGVDVLATVPRVTQGTPILPRIGGRPRSRVLADLTPDAPAVESLRGLRTSLHWGMEASGNNIVMLTGPSAGIGKTFTSVNLAAVMGAAEKRVLLVDTDLRNGSIHQYFRQERGKGFSELIRGRCAFEEAVRRNVLANVDIITTGTLPRNPAEILLSPHTEQLLKDWAQRYDVVLLDTAPVLTMSDPLALAPHAGTVLLLARADVTTPGELDDAARRLARAGGRISGVIFNDFNTEQHRFSARYGAYRATYGGYPAK